ncbi:MAG: transcription-repair coupling factor [Bacteroidota bacterium]|nr:transcription-repair coupling factor [Bacteroidota bacterium]MDX5429966.1 transcription-repair coupling factor [Bacteroidota bacterium]MDX5468739.1 transcription-repair coupling factor [Bacteroidota bacterium]
MNIRQFLDQYREHPQILRLCEQMKLVAGLRVHVEGMSGSSAAIIAGAAYESLQEPMLVVVNDEEEASYFRTDFENVTGVQVLVFPSSYKKAFREDSLDKTSVLLRAEALARLSDAEETPVLVTYPQAIAERVIAQKALEKNSFRIREGENFDLDFLMELLAEHHFDRVDFVFEAGQFSIRGGIIDVFSFGNDLPYRIELDGDVVESIREFDPEDQLSVKRIKSANILPNIQNEGIAEERVSFFDYLPKATRIWIKDVNNTVESIESGLEKARQYRSNLEDKSNFQDIDILFEEGPSIKKHLGKYGVVEFGSRAALKPDQSYTFRIKPQPYFNKNFERIIADIKGNAAGNIQTLIFSDTSKQIERLYSIFADIDKTVTFEPVYKGLSEGFIDEEFGVACYTDHQLFDRYFKYRNASRSKASNALTLKELSELKPGDFVVHLDHGIGKFIGLEKLEVNGVKQEVVRLIYKNNDLLYVHINSLHKISKYVGKDGTEPVMHRLGSDSWEKLKKNTKKKVKDIARDLIKLYAARKAQPGFAFSPDNYLQTELEASFIYEDTPDQSKATEDVKKDMEQEHPMDRLVCGDVGFGKTEVAIRAAFKAVCDSKQVAVLVPTTILAQQHYKTFRSRLKEFPCNVDFINRFRTAKQQTEILKKLEEGKIDILIGTHKLISKKTKFKDLGLLIIDEEQKFGVAAKEKLKQFKVNVDTLTLTATPIPRTLHFSLMGARDLSVINTPPPNRQAVKTEIHVFNRELIKEAVEHELDRGGQVFMIHHRVRDIQDIAQVIRDTVPGAKVAVAHGQMDGDHLEDVMIKFVEGEFDVLVATTIIESGLDIPNANTIIINNAHMFGLSDLHQMRGRVGRSNKKAYCYLLSPPLSTLTQEARKRLSAIEQFSELGSGFNVAMRDLDIRGAGNLLGGEQSGFIAEIGFDMYQKILDEALRELKRDEFSDLFKEEEMDLSAQDCQVESYREILLPDDYVRSISERLSLYNDLAKVKTSEELNKFGFMLKDRFGPLPPPVLELLDAVRLKWKARDLGFEKVSIDQGSVKAWFPSDQESHYYSSAFFGNILKYITSNPSRCRMKQTAKSLTVTFEGVQNISDCMTLFEELLAFARAAQ